MADRDPAAVVRRLYDAVEEEDHETVRDCVVDDVRWRQAASAVPAAGEELVGAEAAIERILRSFEEDWDGFTEEIDDLDAVDGHVVATGTYRGTYRPTGRDLEAEFCHLWRVADGRITDFRQFTDTAAFARVTDREV